MGERGVAGWGRGCFCRVVEGDLGGEKQDSCIVFGAPDMSAQEDVHGYCCFPGRGARVMDA